MLIRSISFSFGFTFFIICIGVYSAACLGQETIHVAYVACGEERLGEALAAVRSTLLSTSSPEMLYFHIVHHEDDTNGALFDNVLKSWQGSINFQYSLYLAKLPEDYGSLFAPCAAQRLFLHELLPPSIERVIYLDVDTVLLEDIGVLWRIFAAFQPETFAAMAAEHEPTHQHAYYKDHAKHPYYNQHGVHGLNSGVILLDVGRLRSMPWNSFLDRNLKEHDLKYHDQDLLNIYFHAHPERLHLLSCRWNYRTDHCFFQPHCRDVADVDDNSQPSDWMIGLLHGSRGVFHKSFDDKWSVYAFRVVFEAFATIHPSVWVSCDQVYSDFESKVTNWMKFVTAADMTNNCQSSALPNIVVTMKMNCERVTSAIQDKQHPLSRLKHLQDIEL